MGVLFGKVARTRSQLERESSTKRNMDKHGRKRDGEYQWRTRGFQRTLYCLFNMFISTVPARVGQRKE